MFVYNNLYSGWHGNMERQNNGVMMPVFAPAPMEMKR